VADRLPEPAGDIDHAADLIATEIVYLGEQQVRAVIGGWSFNLFGMREMTGLNIYSLVVAVVGAVVFLLVYELILRLGV
jgi:uncharacterized membrane protein YeaQ/YmgE (transglycosylase-associated protein family)